MPVIIIENANELSLESLRFVLQLFALRYAESQFRIILFADDIINNRLDDSNLKDLTTGVLRNIHIPLASISIAKTKTHIVSDHQSPSTEFNNEEESETESSKLLRGLFFIIIGLVLLLSFIFILLVKKMTK